jgi:hypothetical protein
LTQQRFCSPEGTKQKKELYDEHDTDAQDITKPHETIRYHGGAAAGGRCGAGGCDLFGYVRANRIPEWSTLDTTSGLYGGTSGATWQAVTAATTDGADALTKTSGDGGYAFLPFTPVAGYVYTLTMNFTFPASGGWGSVTALQ